MVRGQQTGHHDGLILKANLSAARSDTSGDALREAVRSCGSSTDVVFYPVSTPERVSRALNMFS